MVSFLQQELRTSRDKVVVLEQQNQSSTAKLLERDQEIQELHRVGTAQQSTRLTNVKTSYQN